MFVKSTSIPGTSVGKPLSYKSRGFKTPIPALKVFPLPSPVSPGGRGLGLGGFNVNNNTFQTSYYFLLITYYLSGLTQLAHLP